jgi:hypothetical protein
VGRLRRKFSAEAHPDSQFLAQLTAQRRLRALARLHFAPRELPEAGQLLGGTAAGREQHGRFLKAIHYGSAHHLYQSSHRPIL